MTGESGVGGLQEHAQMRLVLGTTGHLQGQSGDLGGCRHGQTLSRRARVALSQIAHGARADGGDAGRRV